MSEKNQYSVKKVKDPKMYAKEKLEEAFYFLSQMRRLYAKRNEFIYNLNAFLNSTRNVTFALQKEFSHNQKFMTWYLKKREEMKKDSLMKFFIDKRNISVKETTPKHSLSLKVAYLIPSERKETIGYVNKKIASEEKDIASFLIMPTYDKEGNRGKPQFIEPTYTMINLWEFDDAHEGYDGKDIMSLCITYFHKLKTVISEAEQMLTIIAFKEGEKNNG